jgi:hypothetical protein
MPSLSVSRTASRPEELPPLLFPDPCLTANLYCNRRLELLAREVLGGLTADLVSAGDSPEAFFWFTRYGKCGEHLKVRVHGPSSAAATARASLEEHAARFFATAASDPDPDLWLSKSAIPPIDPEDEQVDDYSNKTLLWTSYRRSPIVFGAEVYLDDDVHAGRFCRCQAAVTSLALDILLPRFGDPSYLKHRQAVYIQILLTAISVLGLSPVETASYLAYHRDWLIRSLVYSATPPGSITFEGILEELQGRASSMAAALRPLTDHVERALAKSQPSSEYCHSFHEEFSRFYEHVSGYRGDARFDQDPFTRDFAFLPVFKALHFSANQFGFRLSHEAYVFNLLHHAMEALCGQPTMAAQD